MTMRRIWKVRLEVRPGAGRDPFEVVETVDLPSGSQPPTTGSVVPAWVHSSKAKAHVEFDSPDAIETMLNQKLAAAGMEVDLPEGVTDPAEIQRILTEQFEAQQRAAEPNEPDGGG